MVARGNLSRDKTKHGVGLTCGSLFLDDTNGTYTQARGH